MKTKLGQITLLCQTCGTTFERRRSYHNHLVNRRGILATFCSKTCKDASERVSPCDSAFADYAAGMTLKQIGDKLGVSWTTVRNRLIAAGVKMRPQPRFTKTNNPTKGAGHSDEAKAKLKEANRVQFSDPAARDRHALLTCKQIQAGRTGKAYNGLESRVADILEAKGIEFVQQYRLGRFLFDFYIPATNTLIEVHGTFWHADPRFYSRDRLSPIQIRNLANDARKAERATKDGYALEIIWEADVP